MHDALLDDRLLPGRVDRLGETLQPVADGDEHVLDAPVLQLGEHLQPEPCSLASVAGPDPEDVVLTVHGDAHNDIERSVPDLPVPHLHHDRVDEDHRIQRVQGSGRPFGELAADLLRDPADRVLGDLRAIDLIEMRRDLTRREPARSQRQHDLIGAIQPSLPLRDDHRLERPVPVPGNLDLHGSDLGEHRLRPRPVAHVLADRGPAMIVAEVFGQLSVQRRLEDVLRELIQQPSRADQAHALLLRLRQQPLGKVLLIDNLSRHGIDHRLFQQLGRVSHGHLLSDQAGPHPPLIRQSPRSARPDHQLRTRSAPQRCGSFLGADRIHRRVHRKRPANDRF